MRYNIDFFELLFLAQTCIPPVPIARATFWHRLINEIYYDMSDDECNRLFDSITTNRSFKKENEDCQWFYARFNPNNQYILSCFHKGKVKEITCFKKDDKYWTQINRSINENYIKSVTKI
jgi:hypothetical protein